MTSAWLEHGSRAWWEHLVHRIFGVLVTAAALSVALAAASAWADNDARERRLREQFTEAYRAHNWHEAIATGLEIERLTPGRAAHQYNLACVFALGGDREAALDWLERAARNGFGRVTLLATDPDLETVRASDRFDRLAAAVQRNFDAVRAEIERRFRETPPLLFLPPDHDPSTPTPLLIALHGFGDRADGTPTQWRRLSAKRGIVLVVPQGARRAGPGYSWHSVEDADTILGLTLDWLDERLAVDPGRVVLTGFSQGGFMAMALGARHPELFAGVIPVAGGYLPEIDAPQPAVGRSVPRYYFMVGSRDDAAPQSRLAAADFDVAGYEVELRVLPGLGHVFPRDTSRELRKALDFALGQ
jgi:predicted esterase